MKTKWNKMLKTTVAVTGCAVLFGVIGGVAFQGVNYIGGKIVCK